MFSLAWQNQVLNLIALKFLYKEKIIYNFKKLRRGFIYISDFFKKKITGEFDPGSGRMLAVCLTHASRTRFIC